MRNPKVSVIMSVYKEPVEWLHESIDSILNQTFTDFEFIIICDNPSYDEGKVLLHSYKEKDNRIVIIENEQNIGLTKSLNKGLAIAKGEYIARMDADDISLPERFEKQVAYLDNHPKIGVCGSAISFFGSKTGEKTYPLSMDNIWLFLESCFAHPTVMIRHGVLAGLTYNEECVVSQDYNLWVDLFSQGILFGNLQEPLLNYRYSSQQIMSTKGNLQIEISKKIRRKALRKYYEKKGLNSDFISEEWQLEFADKIIKDLNLQNVENVKKQLIYYTFLSIKKSVFYIVYVLVFHGYLSRMNLRDLMLLLYLKIKRINFSKC